MLCPRCGFPPAAASQHSRRSRSPAAGSPRRPRSASLASRCSPPDSIRGSAPMPEYLAPGVFVEEVSFAPPQIRPASTSVAGMVGPTRTGPIRGRPQLLTSFHDYVTYFGDAEDLNFGGTTVTNYT